MKNTAQKLSFILTSVLLIFTSCSSELIEEDLVDAPLTSISNSDLTAEDTLDYGLYWFDANNTPYKGFDEKNNTVLDVPTSAYDPAKPTMIYFHGWMLGSSVSGYSRNTFELIDDENDIDINTAEIWKEKGWNVAIFYWNQFADELEVKDAEAKIWHATKGPQQMRYRLSDGSYSTTQSPTSNLSKLASNQIRAILADNTSNNIRLVGHSLGNQLAVHVAKLMSNAVENGNLASGLMPNRVELLDPFWSQDAKSYLTDMNEDGENDWTGERVRLYINDIKEANNVAVTWYKSTLILSTGIGDGNNDLKEEVAFQSVRLWYLDAIDVVNKHSYVRHNYFWSMAFDAPTEVTLNFWKQRKATGNDAASASTSNERIIQLMDSGYLWDQVEGRYTPTPSDDQFEYKKW